MEASGQSASSASTGTGIDVVAFASPLRRASSLFRAVPGATLAEIADLAGLDPARRPYMTAKIMIGHKVSEVTPAQWHLCRPRDGALVEFSLVIHGPALGAVLSAVVGAAAPALVGAILPGLAAGSFALALATTAVTIVGQLLISALIPPAGSGGPRSDDPTFTITGAQNAVLPYGVYPTVIGRHMMFPPMTGKGYTETVDGEVYWRGRYTFGYGPVSLDNLMIGTTPITDFDDVEIEFLNVNRALTEAEIPALVGNPDVSWVYGTTRMELYPRDIVEDSYSVLLTPPAVDNTPGPTTVRITRPDTREAQVDISFTGLVWYTKKGKEKELSVKFRYRYRAVGAGTWIAAGEDTYTGETTSFIRFTKRIIFPADGEYEVEVARMTSAWDGLGSSDYDDAYLSGIRSIQRGGVPSHADIAEVAVRIRAQEQLSGTIDTLNGVVNRLVPVWTGSAWTAPAKNRHPAWGYLAAMRGPMLRRNPADSMIDLAAFKAWADEEAYWRCDTVVDQKATLREILDMIAATGRARRSMSDLKHSIIRDGANSPVVQHFSARNSWGFKGVRVLSRKIHGFRVRCISELREWEQHEFVAYNDGYNAGNATEIETLELRGVVLDFNDGDQGNPYRLARYHMAVAQLRPEEFQFQSELDHLRCQMGDKIRITHPVALFGVGTARVRSITTIVQPGPAPAAGAYVARFDIDDWNGLEGGTTYRVRIRRRSSNETLVTAMFDGTGFSALTQDILSSSFGVNVDDLVLIERITDETVELLIRSIIHNGDLTATLSCVAAAPEVLTAASGTIPPYDPQITDVSRFGPPKPTVGAFYSDRRSSLKLPGGGLRPRLAVQIEKIKGRGAKVASLQLRWRRQGQKTWTYGSRLPVQTVLHSNALTPDTIYEFGIRSLDKDQRSLSWVFIGTLTARTRLPFPSAPSNFDAVPGVDAIRFVTPIDDTADEDDFREYRLYAATALSDTLTLVATSKTPAFRYAPPKAAGYTRYKISAMLNNEEEGPLTAYIASVPKLVVASDVITSDPSNLYPDFDMLDNDFYLGVGGAPFELLRTNIDDLGQRLVRIAANAAQQDVVTDYFALSAAADYLVKTSCSLAATGAGGGTARIFLTLASVDNTGGINITRSVQVAVRTDSASAALQLANITTTSSETRARFVMRREGGGTQAARFGGLQVARKTSTELLKEGAATKSFSMLIPGPIFCGTPSVGGGGGGAGENKFDFAFNKYEGPGGAPINPLRVMISGRAQGAFDMPAKGTIAIRSSVLGALTYTTHATLTVDLADGKVQAFIDTWEDTAGTMAAVIGTPRDWNVTFDGAAGHAPITLLEAYVKLEQLTR